MLRTVALHRFGTYTTPVQSWCNCLGGDRNTLLRPTTRYQYSMDHNRLQLLGNVTRSPQHVITNADGSRCVNFSVITGHAFKKGETEMQDKMEMDIIAWNNLADWCSEHVRMNDRVLVEGRLKQRRVAQGTSICKVYEMVLEKILPHSKSKEPFNDQNMGRFELKKPPLKSASGINLDNLPE